MKTRIKPAHHGSPRSLQSDQSHILSVITLKQETYANNLLLSVALRISMINHSHLDF